MKRGEFLKVGVKYIEVAVKGNKPQLTNILYDSFSGYHNLTIDIPTNNFFNVAKWGTYTLEKKEYKTHYTLRGKFKLIYEDGIIYAHGQKESCEQSWTFWHLIR